MECQVTEAAVVTTLTAYKPGMATVLLINSTNKKSSLKYNQRSGSWCIERKRYSEKERERGRGKKILHYGQLLKTTKVQWPNYKDNKKESIKFR